MIKLSALIIDDEFHARENLKAMLGNYCPEIEVIGEADSGQTARKIIYEKNPDVIFLDINMPVMDGFDFLESLPERNFSVVFVSAHMEYGIRAVKARAVDYLLKPLSIKELQLCVKNLISINKKDTQVPANETSGKHKIVLTHFQGFSVYETNEIIRFEAEGNYTKVFIADKKPMTISKSLKYFEDAGGNDFFRIHKSHLINLKFLKEFLNQDGGYVILQDGTKLEISRRKLPEFTEKVKTILK